MTVKNVTLSGDLFDINKKAIADKKIDVYRLNDLFTATLIHQITTNPTGNYELNYQMNGLKDHLVLIAPGQAGESLFKKYIPVSENHPNVTIPSPPLQQKKKRSNHRHSHQSVSNFDDLAKRTLGPDWESQLIDRIPNKTTPLIQESYRETQLPLQEQEELNFLLNSLFWNPPKVEKDGRRLRFYITPSDTGRYERKEIPEVIIDLKLKVLYSIESVSLRYKDEVWVECKPKDPDFKRFLYLANCTAISIGLIGRLVGLGLVLPNMYAQAYLATISSKNPLKQLLGAHLTETLLINQHIGLPATKPLLELAKCTGMTQDEMEKIVQEQLLSDPLEIAQKPTIQENFARTLLYYKMNVIRPVVSDFFEYHRYAFEGQFWGEIYQLSNAFAELHPLGAKKDLGWWSPFTKSPLKPGKGEMQKFKEWCENALLITTFMPHAIAKSVDYLTDLRFASLLPINRALEEDQKSFETHGGTTPENAAKQLSRAYLFLQKEGTPLLFLPKKYPTFNTHLENTAEVLRAYGVDPADLFAFQAK